MGQIGDILKATRETRGITIRQAEDDTKIRAKYLEALENEKYDDIPGRIYVKGFLSNYAAYLGLDSTELLQVLKESFSSEDEGKPIEISKPNPYLKEKKSKKRYRFRPTKLFRYFLALLAIIILVAFNSWWHSRNQGIATNSDKLSTQKVDQTKDSTKDTTQKDDTKTNENKDNQQPKTDIAQNQSGQKQDQVPPQEPTQQSGVHLVLKADKGTSWVRITVDGSVAFEGNINMGETKNFDGKDKVSIRLGNAGAVNVTFNNKNIGYLGDIGVVMDKDYTTDTKIQ